MKLSNTKTTTVVTKVYTYNLVGGFKLKVTEVDGKITRQEILKNKVVYCVVSDGEKFREEAKKNLFNGSNSKTGEVWYVEHIITDPLTHFMDNTVPLKNLIRINGWDHSYMDSDGNYIEFLTHVTAYHLTDSPERSERDGKFLNYSKLREHLKNHPRVSNVKKVDLYDEYYYGLEFDVLIDPSWINPEAPHFRKDDVVFWGENDPLGIKSFYEEKDPSGDCIVVDGVVYKRQD